MNRSRVAPVVLAVLAISALGVASTTLETTVSAGPEDVINLSWDYVPIGQDEVAAVQSEMQGSEGSETQQSEAGSGSATTEDEGGGAESKPASDGDGDRQGGSARSKSQTSPSVDESTPRSRLLALLRILLGIVGVAVVAALLYRYRTQLRALLSRESASEPTAESPTDAEWPGVEPSNVVDRAWLRVVERVDSPETMTVEECAALARDQGLDAAATEAIATAFERVHYGSRPVAEEESRARTGLQRLDGDDG